MTEFHDLDLAPGQEIVIGGTVAVKIARCKGRRKSNAVHLGVAAPAGVPVERKERRDRMRGVRPA